eukprot:829808-Pyramimonas_sp.AAC.1
MNITVVGNRCNEANHVPSLCTVHLDSRSIVGVEALRASSLDHTTPPPLDPCRGSIKPVRPLDRAVRKRALAAGTRRRIPLAGTHSLSQQKSDSAVSRGGLEGV